MSFDSPAFSSQATVDDLKREAIRTAEQLLEAYPDAPDSMRVKANLESSLGNSDASVSIWRRIIDVDPNHAEAYFNLGRIAGNGGDFQEAAQMFAKAASLAPNNLMAPALQAEALMRLGEVEAAVSLLEQHVRGPAVLDKAMLMLGQAYLQANDLDRAKQTFESLIKADPSEARAYYGLATVLARLGQREESRQNMEKFQSLAAVDHDKLANQKRAYVDVAMMRAILVTTFVESGQVFRARGDSQKAEQTWRKAARLEPNDTASRLGLLHLYEEQSRDYDALEICEHLCLVEAENANNWLMAGLLRHRLGQRDLALDALEQATRLDPGNPKYEWAREMVREED